MEAAVETLNRWSEAWVGLAWAVTWQSTGLIGLAAVVALVLRRSSPVLRYGLWQIVAIKILVMPFWTVAVPLPFLAIDRAPRQSTLADEAGLAAVQTDGPGGPGGAPSVQAAQPGGGLRLPGPSTTSPPLSWQSWLLVGWLLVVAAQFAALARQRVALGRLLRKAVLAAGPLRGLVGELGGQLGLRHVPMALVTDADCSFFACGVWRPVLVLPKKLLAALDEARLRQVLLHELAHVRRRDLLFGWPIEIVRRLLFFNPLVHWLAYRVRLERELACDQLAMVCSGRGPGDYIDTLVHVVAQSVQPTILKAVAVTAGLDGNANGPVARRGKKRTATTQGETR